jgi:hypothetical protein
MFAFSRRLAHQARLPRQISRVLMRFCGRAALAGGVGYAYWEQQGITEQDISRAIREFINTSKVFFDSHPSQSSCKQIPSSIHHQVPATESGHKKKAEFSKTLGDDWEQIIVQDNYQVIF